MLPATARLRRADDFVTAIRSGRRGASRNLVAYLYISEVSSGVRVPPRAGFVVSGKVGNSVVRHRVTRRLRPLVRERLGALPGGSLLVIRALPSAGDVTSDDLARDLDRAMAGATRPVRGSERVAR